MISLYNITDEQRNIYLQLEANDGELSEELAEALELNQKNFKDKVGNYVIFMDSIQAQQAMIDKELERLAALKKRLSNTLEKLETNLTFAMDLFGTEDTKKKSVLKYYEVLGTRKIELKKSTSIKVIDPRAVPFKYKTFSYGLKTDNTQIKKDIESGELIPTDMFYIEEKKVVKIN